MAKSVKYRENTLAFVYGVFAALSLGTGAAVLYSRGFDFSTLSIVHWTGLGVCVLLMGYFLFRAFQQAFLSGLGGFLLSILGVVAVAAVLFLPAMLDLDGDNEKDADVVEETAAEQTPTMEVAEDALVEVTAETGPTGCVLWSDVDNTYVDQDICVYGELSKVYSSEGASFMLFSDETGAFFLLAYNWGDAGLKGRCVQTNGVVGRLGASPVIVVGAQEDLQFCD